MKNSRGDIKTIIIGVIIVVIGAIVLRLLNINSTHTVGFTFEDFKTVDFSQGDEFREVETSKTINTSNSDDSEDVNGTFWKILQIFGVLITVIGFVGPPTWWNGIISKILSNEFPPSLKGNPNGTKQNVNRATANDFAEKIGHTKLKMVFVKGDTFIMGRTKEQGGYDDENPVRNVIVDDYYIGKYPVTQKQWVEVMGKCPSVSHRGDNLPVDNISWDDAWEFIHKLREMTHQRYRLLTEAEWEYAARGGLKSKGYTYAGSNHIDKVAYNGNDKIQPVGTKKPNELGIYDMSGNVCEWVSDLYEKYNLDSVKNPEGPPPNSSKSRQRVLRGGSYNDKEEYCKVFRRNKYDPNLSRAGVGFRLALRKREEQDVEQDVEGKNDVDVNKDTEPQNVKIVNNGSYFTDPRDGQKYRTAKIGDLVWMCENLNFAFKDSCCYDNDLKYGEKYGRLYTWDTAMEACPDGWHLPTLEDWNNLIKSAGGKVAGEKLKSKNEWNKNGNGTDDFGFSALPSGHCDYKYNATNFQNFHMMFNQGSWWSATKYDNERAYFLDMVYNFKNVDKLKTFKTSSSLSVRCVQYV